MERVSRKPMITMGIAFVNNVGKFALKSLATSRDERPGGTLPQTFNRQPGKGETESKRGEGRENGREGILRTCWSSPN